MKIVKVRIEEKFKERWERNDGRSLSDLTSLLLEIQHECAKPNSPNATPLNRVYKSQEEKILNFLKQSELKCENLTPQEREKLYFKEIRRLTNVMHHEMTKDVVEFTNLNGILNPESIKKVKNLLLALKPPAESVQQIDGKQMAEFWQQLFHANPASMHSTFTPKQLENMNVDYLPRPFMEVNYLIRVSEVKDSIKCQSIGKAPGDSGLRAEMLRYGGDKVAEILTDGFRDFFCKDHGGKGKPVPDNLITAKVCALKKPKGPPTDPGSYRSIFLLEVVGKILCRILIKRIEPIIDTWLRDSQCGFRQQRSTAHAITALTLCQQKAHNCEIELWAVYIDIKKAFDSPSHNVIEQVLKYIGVPCCVLKILMNFHKEVEHFVGSKLNRFSCGRGSRQGSIEAPGLFCIIYEFLIRAAEIENDPECGLYFESEMKQGGMKFPQEWAENENLRVVDLLFADDWAILCRSKEAANRLLVKINTVCEQLGILISAEKTKLMPLALPKGKVVSDTELVYCGNEVVEQVETFSYLGNKFRANEGARISSEAIKNAKIRLFKAQKRIAPLLRQKALSPKFRSTIIRCYGMGSLLYGCEAWVLTEPRIRQLEVSLMRLRRLLLRKRKYECTIQGILKNRNLAWMTRKIFPSSVRDFLCKQRLQFLLQVVCTEGTPFLRKLLFSRPVAEKYGQTKGNRTTYWGMIVKDFQWVTGFDPPTRAQKELPKFFEKVMEASKIELDRLKLERLAMLEEKKIKELPLVTQFQVRIAHGKTMKKLIKSEINGVFQSDRAKAYRVSVGVKFKTEAEAKAKTEKCTVADCWAVFQTVGGRRSHMARAHRTGEKGSIALERQSLPHKCPKCKLTYAYRNKAISHCRAIHKLILK